MKESYVKPKRQSTQITPLMQAVGARLCEIRIQHGFAMRDVEACGQGPKIATQYLGEKGLANMRVDTLQCIARILDVHVASFLLPEGSDGWEGSEAWEASKIDEIDAFVYSLTNGQLAQLRFALSAPNDGG